MEPAEPISAETTPTAAYKFMEMIDRFSFSIPVDNTSVNPARSTGPALFVGGWALSQLWLFWVAPIAGALIAGFVYRWLSPNDPDPIEVSGKR